MVDQRAEPFIKTGGFYTLHEAARILKISSEAQIRGWLKGYGSRAAPVIQRQYSSEEHLEIGFFDLMEIRFINFFRNHKVSLQSIRKAAAAARSEFSSQHPFALSNIRFVTDRKRIFHLTASETKDTRLRDMITGQFTMYDIVERCLAKGVEFDPLTGLPESWRPDPDKFPDVVISPFVANGLPVIMKYDVPTTALFNCWNAEENSYEAVADWYQVPQESVRQAVDYERDLDLAA